MHGSQHHDEAYIRACRHTHPQIHTRMHARKHTHAHTQCKLAGCTRGSIRRLDLGQARVSAEPVDVEPLQRMHQVLSEALEELLGFEREYGAQVRGVRGCSAQGKGDQGVSAQGTEVMGGHVAHSVFVCAWAYFASVFMGVQALTPHEQCSGHSRPEPLKQGPSATMLALMRRPVRTVCACPSVCNSCMPAAV